MKGKWGVGGHKEDGERGQLTKLIWICSHFTPFFQDNSNSLFHFTS